MTNLKSHVQIHATTHTSYYIPILLPDEYWIGYLGRLLILNGMKLVRDYGNINKFLNKLLSEDNSDYMNNHICQKVAAISFTKIEIIVQHHSLIPFLRPIKKNSRPTTLDGICKSLAFRFIKKEVYFCRSCITEDFQNYGTSYWRRSHQLPGINWCLKHKHSLSFIKKKNVMHLPPDIYYKSAIHSESLITEEITENSLIKKYTEVVQRYAENSPELNTRNLASLLSQKAFELNLIKYSKDQGKFISDYLIEETPSCWRIEHFPDLKKTTLGQFLKEFDYALLAKKPTKKLNILLIISALFPSGINALLEIAKYDEMKKKVTETVFSEKEILTAYINNFGQTKKIAKEINCSYETTVKWLVYFAFYPLEAVSQKTIEALIAFNQGITMEKILSMHDINLKQLFLITHPDIKGMKQLLNSIKIIPPNYAPLKNGT